jgi:hypothetical protein
MDEQKLIQEKINSSLIMTPSTRLIDLTVGEFQLLMSEERAKMLKEIPKPESDEYFTKSDFMKYFKVSQTTLDKMIRQKKNPVPFDGGRGKRARILKSVAEKWWKEHSNDYKL